MNIEVTSVTRHPEKLLQAASAIQVITQDDIRRSGATSIPEALRLADNLEVAQKNSHDWAISARGFNTALGNKLLVMIDGRTVYTPLYSGVFWDVQDYLLEDIDRIEVISGPGGTLWGANAVNGVINIITKSAADTKGLYAEAGGGNQLEEFGGARYGGTLGSEHRLSRLREVLRPRRRSVHGRQSPRRMPGTRSGAVSASTPRLRRRTASVFTATSTTGTKTWTQGARADAGGGNMVGRWTHVFSDESDLSLQSYYDRDPPAPLRFAAFYLEYVGACAARDAAGRPFDLRYRLPTSVRSRRAQPHRVGSRLSLYARCGAGMHPRLGLVPAVLDQNLYSAFLQDEIRLGHDWSATIGSKVEHNDYTGFEVEPNARLEWGFAPGQALWSAISRAARTPSRIDRDLVEPAPPTPLVVLEGGRDFGSEYVTAYELGFRGGLGSRVTGSISTFYNVYDDVRSTSITPGTIVPLYFANNLEGDTYGVELSGTYQVLENWSLHAGYDLLAENLHVKPGQFDLNDALNETSDPKHQFSIRSALNLPWRVDFDVALRWVDALLHQQRSDAGHRAQLLRNGYPPGVADRKGLELSLVGQNLLHAHHAEYGFPSPTTVQIQRSVYGKIAWRF